MRRQHNDETGTVESLLHLWNYSEALKAAPYLRTLLHSLREHWLGMHREQRQLKLLDARLGRSDCHTLILRAEAVRSVEHAIEDFEETMHELLDIDVFCINPVCGVALIPFRQGKELAWFIFDFFAPEGLSGWRFHADPLDMRRPLTFLFVAQ